MSDHMYSDDAWPGNDEAVLQLAYQLWESEGRPDGRQDEFWYAAERHFAAANETPSEPADPHPTDENPSNVYNPAPGGDIANELHSGDLESNPSFPGSPA